MFKTYVVYSWGLKKIVIILKTLFELLLHIGIFKRFFYDYFFYYKHLWSCVFGFYLF
jgi:hypothetical protein